jgi:sucrose-6-phosphate hydrolase SacC (GH32 family)
MIGENKSPGVRFAGVNCYSSPNLVEWTYVGPLLTEQALQEHRVVERPKVLYNPQTRKYVLYVHADSGDYKQARVGVATSDTVCGRYTFRKSYRPLGHESRDMGLYQEPDGSAYLLSEDVSHHISPISQESPTVPTC